MRGILGLMVMASVVFGASLTSINTHRRTGNSNGKKGTQSLPTLWDKQNVSFVATFFSDHR